MTEFGMGLLSDISKSFDQKLRKDRRLKRIANKVRDGTDYEIASDYSIRVGELLSESIQENTKSLAYMSREVAEEVLPPLLTVDHNMVTEVTDIIQQNMNVADGVMLGVQTPALDTNRISGFVEKVASYSDFDGARWVLGEPIVNYSQSIVDQAVRDNAKASAKAGVTAYIVRKAEASATVTRGRRKYHIPCKWCSALEGTYEYLGNGSNIPHEVYQKHEACRCTLTFKRGNFRQNVWDHRETWTENDVKQQRKLTKAEEKRLKKEAEQKERERSELKLREIGFDYVSDDLWKKADRNLLNANIDRLGELDDKFGIIKRAKKPMFLWDGRTSSIAYVRSYSEDFSLNELAIGKYYKNLDEFVEDTKRWVRINWSMPIDLDNQYEVMTYSITHEYGHMMHNVMYQQLKNTGKTLTRDEYVSNIVREIFEDTGVDRPYELLSDYGKKNCYEAFAEMFANSQGSKPNALGLSMRKWLERNAL